MSVAVLRSDKPVTERNKQRKKKVGNKKRKRKKHSKGSGGIWIVKSDLEISGSLFDKAKRVLSVLYVQGN